MRQSGELYREEVSFFWGWLGMGIFFITAVTALILFLIQQTYDPIGDIPTPNGLYPIIAAVFFAIGLLMANFARLTIRLDPQGVSAGYGPFRHFEPWDNIAEAELDRGLYGGWGIRYGRKDGNAALVYNVNNAPILTLRLKEGKSTYFGFSTKHPDEVTSLINNWKC
ncbi:MAG: hypothetical protein FWH51_02795 [Dehalococcoidia bacterium]|nr:hypothetical protein [Dehalococcoidia bacterium]